MPSFPVQAEQALAIIDPDGKLGPGVRLLVANTWQSLVSGGEIEPALELSRQLTGTLRRGHPEHFMRWLRIVFRNDTIIAPVARAAILRRGWVLGPALAAVVAQPFACAELLGFLGACDPRHLMTPGELALLNALPDTVELMRGGPADPVACAGGLSWTPSYGLACQFADLHAARGNPSGVVRARIPKDRIVVLFGAAPISSRGENRFQALRPHAYEVVVDPANVHGIEEVAQDLDARGRIIRIVDSLRLAPRQAAKVRMSLTGLVFADAPDDAAADEVQIATLHLCATFDRLSMADRNRFLAGIHEEPAIPERVRSFLLQYAFKHLR